MAQNTIAIVFDFDDTLAPDSTSSFLEHIGLDVRAFWKRAEGLIREGHDPVPAYLQLMIAESQKRPATQRITRERLKNFGRKISLHRGAEQIFARVRRQIRSISSGLKVEFYVISSGIGEVLRQTKVSAELSDIFSSDFYYNQKGEIEGLKNVVSFTDKTRFIFQISKGIVGGEARRDPFAVNKKLKTGELKVPLHQMIVVGDGFTDIPCFSLIQKSGGVAIGVYDRASRERWGKAWGFLEDQRVSHLVTTDYRKNSGLDDALSLAIDRMARDVLLKTRTYQG